MTYRRNGEIVRAQVEVLDAFVASGEGRRWTALEDDRISIQIGPRRLIFGDLGTASRWAIDTGDIK